ncbi:MAG TPA: four helix bundle protein [Vicinamibacterales bacterium]|nr:four helix bundle protein [Vicinamibacterales bacterium]
MTGIRDHKDLEAWRVAMDLVLLVYSVSAEFPEAERYGLTAQMRRAAVSVPSNIAEGQARGVARACVNFLTVALASLSELDTQLQIALRLKFIPPCRGQELDRLITSSRKLVAGLRRAKRMRLGVSVAGTVAVLFLGVQVCG